MYSYLLWDAKKQRILWSEPQPKGRKNGPLPHEILYPMPARMCIPSPHPSPPRAWLASRQSLVGWQGGWTCPGVASCLDDSGCNRGTGVKTTNCCQWNQTFTEETTTLLRIFTRTLSLPELLWFRALYLDYSSPIELPIIKPFLQLIISLPRYLMNPCSAPYLL